MLVLYALVLGLHPLMGPRNYARIVVVVRGNVSAERLAQRVDEMKQAAGNILRARCVSPHEECHVDVTIERRESGRDGSVISSRVDFPPPDRPHGLPRGRPSA
jgi:hypothetical protein